MSHQPQIESTGTTSRDHAAQRRAMTWSLVIGVGMFVGKGVAWLVTGSAAILSDAAESVVHVAAVVFAAWSLWLAQRPPDREHPYGHDKINYFSAGFEGAMIGIAALYIIYESVRKLVVGPELDNIGWGALLVTVATALNGLLAWYLIRTGRREGSIILVANGKHVLTDSLTSLGVLVALGLVALTGIVHLDPIIAILIAAHILRSGVALIRESFDGLMDRRDPGVESAVRDVLDAWQNTGAGAYHELRNRVSGDVVWVDVHLLFPGPVGLERAHADATRLETEIQEKLRPRQLVITTHLEPLGSHDRAHPPEDAAHHHG